MNFNQRRHPGARADQASSLWRGLTAPALRAGRVWPIWLLGLAFSAHAQEIDLKLSCSHSTGAGEARVILADSAEIRIRQGNLLAFRWESSLHRRTHGFDCSIDLDDKLELQKLESGWRVSAQDAAAARMARGYDTDRGNHCLVNLYQKGDMLHIAPSCPALCGSRLDFAELAVHLPTGRCTYYHPTE